MVYIVAVLAVISTLLGGLFAIRFKDKLHLILGFSAGAVIGVAFFDLIPESFDLAGGFYDFKTIASLMALGFAALLILDRAFSIHPHEDECCEKPEHKSPLSAVMLVLHSLLDGVAIGLSFKVSPVIGWTVALAVLAHDFSDGINTVSIIFKNKGENKSAKKWLIADSLAPAVGVIATLFFVVSEPVLGIILAIFAGFFIYIGASDLIPESHHEHPTIWTSVMTVLGIVVLYAIISFAV